jgi:hypothetical protein
VRFQAALSESLYWEERREALRKHEIVPELVVALKDAKTVLIACLLSFEKEAGEEDKKPVRDAIEKAKLAIERAEGKTP